MENRAHVYFVILCESLWVSIYAKANEDKVIAKQIVASNSNPAAHILVFYTFFTYDIIKNMMAQKDDVCSLTFPTNCYIYYLLLY
jgi:hypothetical protein